MEDEPLNPEAVAQSRRRALMSFGRTQLLHFYNKIREKKEE